MVKKYVVAVAAIAAIAAHLSFVACDDANGFAQPVAENDVWSLYQFDAVLTQVYTSDRAAPKPNARGGPGTIYTAAGQLWDVSGNQIGISHLSRFIVADDRRLPGYELEASSNLVHFVCEFGSPEASYYDDVLYISKVWKGVFNATGMIDYDSAIVGGTGRFLGATGDVIGTHTEYLPGTMIPTSVSLLFRAWVPKLPMPPPARR